MLLVLPTLATGGVRDETYTYDSQNRLIGYISPTTTTYAYDALDRRIAKTVGGVTEAWVYDTADLGDSTASNTALTFRAGALVKRWLFGPQTYEPLAYEADAGTTSPGSGAVIELLANRLGSIITAISVSTGAVTAEYDYQAYGARTETVALDQPYGFTGREHDRESGLMHYRARAFDLETGLFLQVDPIEFTSETVGLYGYVENSPLFFTDPSGLAAVHALPGPSMTEMAILTGSTMAATAGALANIYHGGLVNGPVVQIMEGLLRASSLMRAASTAPSSASPDYCHHSKPVYLGGAPDQKLTRIIREVHRNLHRDMRKFLRGFSKMVEGRMRTLDYGPGCSGAMIQKFFSKDEVDAEINDFYSEFEEKYPDAANDWNDHGGAEGGGDCD